MNVSHLLSCVKDIHSNCKGSRSQRDASKILSRFIFPRTAFGHGAREVQVLQMPFWETGHRRIIAESFSVCRSACLELEKFPVGVHRGTPPPSRAPLVRCGQDAAHSLPYAHELTSLRNLILNGSRICARQQTIRTHLLTPTFSAPPRRAEQATRRPCASRH